MNYGCSECLSIAIESRRPELLKALLERPNIAYRDMFWAPMPNMRWSHRYGDREYHQAIPILHELSDDSDLSFIGQPDCGHTLEDVELLDPLTEDTTQRSLVSLPVLAERHSTDDFDALQILRDSGKFDLAEPQFFHRPMDVEFNRQSRRSLLGISYYESFLMHSIRNLSDDQTFSFLFGGGMRLRGRCRLNRNTFEFEFLFYMMQLPQIFHNMIFDGERYDLICMQRQIDKGADLNHYFIVHCSFSPRFPFRSPNSSIENFAFRGLISYLSILAESKSSLSIAYFFCFGVSLDTRTVGNSALAGSGLMEVFSSEELAGIFFLEAVEKL